AVVVNDVSADAADAVVAEIVAAGGSALASHDSVATRTGGRAIVEAALDTFGHIDILISNAGILRQARFEEMSEADIDDVIDVHLKGAFHVGQPAFAAMKRQSHGRILFTASSSGLFGHPWQASYGAAKAGIVGLSNVIALEGKPHGVRSNVIMPNALTGMNRNMAMEWIAEVPEQAATLGELTNLPPATDNRLDPSWVVPLALHLVSEGCDWTHGIFSACNGRYARVAIGAGEGWTASECPSLEDVAAHWPEIQDMAQMQEPHSVYDEALEVRRFLTREA
ncbi:MAG: SDR family NAD(P)-dependent oxidoreductase, partial [Novosphingobium sp.]|nr:SDR family NAD(P)-dependent oxidoreductase [Novosphingobium sp.]